MLKKNLSQKGQIIREAYCKPRQVLYLVKEWIKKSWLILKKKNKLVLEQKKAQPGIVIIRSVIV